MSKYTGVRIEYHILQSFPATCLNRDDVGSPKSVVIGGVERSRVSSQCWKRQVRLALHELGVETAYRTRLLQEKILDLYPEGVSTEKGARIKGLSDKIVSRNTLFFVTQAQVELCKEFIESGGCVDDDNDTKNKSKKKKSGENKRSGKKESSPFDNLIAKLKKANSGSADPLYGMDIALFGRFVAKINELNIEAACSFSHAFTTHKSSSEIDFYSAVDDLTGKSGYLDAAEYSTGTYYRYINLDLGILQQNLGCSDEDLLKAVDVFTKALYIAVPSAKQKGLAGYCPWDYAKVLVRKGQPLQLNFDKPVRSVGNGYLEPSIKALDDGLARNAKLMGSLYGGIGAFTYGGPDENGIDKLCSDLCLCIGAIE